MVLVLLIHWIFCNCRCPFLTANSNMQMFCACEPHKQALTVRDVGCRTFACWARCSQPTSVAKKNMIQRQCKAGPFDAKTSSNWFVQQETMASQTNNKYRAKSEQLSPRPASNTLTIWIYSAETKKNKQHSFLVQARPGPASRCD
jgi:hypothetical protein